MAARTLMGMVFVSAAIRALDLILAWTTDYTVPNRDVAFQLIVLTSLAWIIGHTDASDD